MMLFKQYHLPQIRDGEKTVTRREWDENYAGPNVGSVIAATTELFVSDDEADCYIRVLDRYRQPLGEMDDADARQEGDYDDLDEFREGYERVYGAGAWDPEKVVDVVEFEYVGRTRPDEQVAVTDDNIDQHRVQTRRAHNLDLVCDCCGSTASDVRLVEVEDPDGLVTTCEACEPQLRSTVVSVVDSNELTEGSA